MSVTHKKQETPGAVAKVYDGSRIVPHPVKRGESLAKIADIYLFKTWEPIWKYNAEIFHTVGKDPNFIREGVTILIPRNAQGYADLLRRLHSAKVQAQAYGDQLLYELEGQEYSLKAFTTAIDFAADVFTTLASLGFKAAATAKATKAVEAAKLQAKIAQHLSANAITREFAEKFAQLRSTRMASALSAKVATVKDFVKGAAFKVIGAGAEVADRVAQKASGDEEKQWFSNTWKGMVTLDAARDAWKAWSATKKLLGASVDVAGMALDYLKPSMVAEFYLFATTGETAETSQKNAKKTIKDSVAKSVELIEASIAKNKREMELLYGKA
jgi:hypothetical protein